MSRFSLAASHQQLRDRFNNYIVPCLPYVLGLLVLLISLGFFQLDFTKPTMLQGDYYFLLLIIKLFTSGGGWVESASIGFPGGFIPYGFPILDVTQKALLFFLSLFSSKLFVIANLFFVIAVTFNFSAAYFVLRRLGFSSVLSVLGALFFSMLPMSPGRFGGHDFLATTYGVPFGVYLVYLAANGFERSDPSKILPELRDPFVLFSAAVVSLSGLYNFAFFLLYLALFSVIFLLRNFSVRAFFVRAAIGAIGLIWFFCFAAAPYLYGAWKFGLSFPRRSLVEQAIYGLRIPDVLFQYAPLPGVHRLLSRYNEIRGPFEGQDAWPGPVLSLVVMLALAYAFVQLTYRAASTNELKSAAPLTIFAAAGLLFSILFALPYGFGMMVNLIEPAIRAQNRISAYLGFFAVIIFCGQVQKYQNKIVVLVFAFVLCFVNSYGSLGFFHKRQVAYASVVQAEFPSVAGVFAELDKHNLTRIIQLPVAKFPEAEPVEAFQPYTHLLPFIIDRASSPRKWSYGLSDQQSVFNELAYTVKTAAADVRARTFSCLQFDAALIERRAYPGEPAEVVQRLFGSTKLDILYSDGLRVLVALPKVDLSLDCDSSALAVTPDMPISFAANGLGTSFLSSGWQGPEAWGVWSGSNVATLKIPRNFIRSNAKNITLVFKIGVLLGAGTPTTFGVFVNEQHVADWTYNPANTAEPRSIDISSDLLNSRPDLTIQFRSAPLRSPAEIGLNPNDNRRLGLSLNTVTLKDR